jgi:hypothetical protein
VGSTTQNKYFPRIFCLPSFQPGKDSVSPEVPTIEVFAKGLCMVSTQLLTPVSGGSFFAKVRNFYLV